MIAAAVEEKVGIIQIEAHVVQLRLVQLLLVGRTLGNAVRDVNNSFGSPDYLSLEMANSLVKQFAWGLRPVVGGYDTAPPVFVQTTGNSIN